MSTQSASVIQQQPRSKDPVEWVPVLLWGGVIFLLSTSTFSSINTSAIIGPILRFIYPAISAAALSLTNELVRKTAHFVEYGVLFWLLVRGPMRGRPYIALAACVVYAALDETHQVFVPGRGPSVFDVALDSTGALFSRYLNAFFAELV